MRRLLLLVFLLSVALAIGLRYLPPEWDPRTPLDLTAPPNALAGPKLRWMTHRPAACFAAFAASGLTVSRVPDRPSGEGCGLENALRLVSDVRLAPSQPIVTCPMAAAWVMFERHSLQPAARLHLGSEVAAVRHLGSHACRNVNHAAAGRRSQHATANALDIAGFVLRDGREVRLARDWGGEGKEAAFLRAARDGACHWFRVVLGPEYNAAHRDHLHLDMGPWRLCR